MKRLMIQSGYCVDFRPFFILFLLLLAACSRAVPATPVAVVNTAVPTHTVTIEATKVEIETAVVATSTSLPATATPTITPSPIATSFPTFPANVPLPPDTTFALRPPDSAVLLHIFQLTNPRRVSYSDESLPYYHFELLNASNGAISAVTGNDISKHYANGFPNSLDVIQNPLFLGETGFSSGMSSFWMPTGGLQEVVQQGVNICFTQEPFHFVSGEEQTTDFLFFTPYIAEIDRDSGKEWVLEVKIPHLNWLQYIALDEQNGIYQVIPSDLPTFPWAMYAYDMVLHTNYDFTGDSIHDVFLQSYREGTAGAFGFDIQVFSWNENKLRRLDMDASFDGDLGFSSFPQFDIADYTGDGVMDVRLVVTFDEENFGCEWDEIGIYSWQGVQSQHQFSDGTPPDDPDGSFPDTPLCNVWQALIPFGRIRHVPMVEKIPLLEKVLAELSLETAPSADYLAFIRFHLAMAYFSQGRDDEARYMLNTVYELLDESTYAQIVKTQDELTGESWIDLCRGLLTTTEQIIQTDLLQYVNEGAALQEIGSTHLHDPYLCPLQEMITNRLQSVPLPAQQSPVSLLAEQDLELTVVQSVDLDGDVELEWMGILEMERPTLVIFDAVQDNWEVHFVVGLSRGRVLGLTYDSRDLTGDTIPELLVSVDSVDLVEHRVLLIDIAQSEFREISEQDVLLDEAGALSQLTPDDFFYPRSPNAPPGWFYLEGFSTDEAYISDYLWHLVDELLAEERPFSLPADLTTLITYLPADDPEAQLVINQLTYMLGYYHELEGNNEQAIAAYLQLIQQAPVSPWSWLAWARLEPIP